jgi:Hint module
MDALRIGDQVLVGPGGQVSTVFMFTHREPAAREPFVALGTADGNTLETTVGHNIYINSRLAPAGMARVGDLLLRAADGAHVAVVSIDQVTRAGLYNPQTLHGDIVVDGYVTSTYTTAITPPLAHAFLAPLRFVYALLGLSTSVFDHGAHPTIGSILPRLVGAESVCSA